MTDIVVLIINIIKGLPYHYRKKPSYTKTKNFEIILTIASGRR